MMSWNLVLLLSLVPMAPAADWMPPEKPDPQQILQDARTDADAGHYPLALKKYVWFHQHALTYQPSLYGVRLSFALSYWNELTKVYPPALEKFKQLRDAATQDAIQGKNLRSSFHDLTAMNTTLGEPQRTKDAFVAIEARNPDEAKQIYELAQPALVTTKSYGLCNKYLDPKPTFERIAQRYQDNCKLATNPQFDSSLRGFAENQFASQTTTLIALLVQNQRKSEAETVAGDARKLWKNKTFYAAIDKALTGEVPRPWP